MYCLRSVSNKLSLQFASLLFLHLILSSKVQVDNTTEPPSLISSYASEIASVKVCIENKFQNLKEYIKEERSALKAQIREVFQEISLRDELGDMKAVMREVVKEALVEFLGRRYSAAGNGEPLISFCAM
jgi:hypothetical protein